MNRLLIIFLFLAVCTSTSAQYSITDENSVLTTKEKNLLEKVIDFELAFYVKVFPEKEIKKTDVKLNIFTDYTAYLIYQKEQSGQTRHGSMGFYSSKNKEAVVCKAKQEKRFLETCYHELSHFFVNTYFKSVPQWLNEGLAEYFENSKVTSKGVISEKNNIKIARVKTMIDTRDIDLKDFLNWDRAKFYKVSFSQDGYGYALGYSIVRFLMNQDENLVIGLIREISEGKKPIESIEAVYNGGFYQFEQDFLNNYSK